MAIYHLSMKSISRSAGRSATAAAAYRAGEEITDERTGQVHDYKRHQGVQYAETILPGGAAVERAEFWNRIEVHHKRGDAVLAREVEVSLPAELSSGERQALAKGFCPGACRPLWGCGRCSDPRSDHGPRQTKPSCAHHAFSLPCRYERHAQQEGGRARPDPL